MALPVLETFGNGTEKELFRPDSSECPVFKVQGGFIGFALQKATWISTYKKDRLEEECLLTTPFSFFHDCTCLVSPYHPCPPPLVLLLPVKGPLPSRCWLWLHASSTFWISIKHLPPSTGSFWATKVWRSAGDAFFWRCSSCLSHGASQEPVSERCSLHNWLRTVKIQTLQFSFMPCHYWPLEK